MIFEATQELVLVREFNIFHLNSINFSYVFYQIFALQGVIDDLSIPENPGPSEPSAAAEVAVFPRATCRGHHLLSTSTRAKVAAVRHLTTI